MKSQPNQRPRRGFTLIEVLLVLVILVILASLAVPAYDGIRRRANINAAKTQIGLFKTALRNYNMGLNTYPTTAQGLDSLRNPPGDLPDPSKWDGPYFESNILPDPWGQWYQYESPGRHNPDSFDVWSMGPDMTSGTEDDIGNWDLE